MRHNSSNVVEWGPLYLDYITHYGETSSKVFRRSTVCIVGNMFQLSKWYVGCGFNPKTVWYFRWKMLNKLERLGITKEYKNMPTFDEFYQFLKSYYLHSRFEARNTEGWGSDYSQCVAKSHYDTLERDGVGLISMYESRTATVIKYNQQLEILNPDEPPGQIQKRSGRLTSILGSGANF